MAAINLCFEAELTAITIISSLLSIVNLIVIIYTIINELKFRRIDKYLLSIGFIKVFNYKSRISYTRTTDNNYESISYRELIKIPFKRIKELYK